MKTWITTLAICSMFITACGQATSQPTEMPTLEMPTGTRLPASEIPALPTVQDQTATSTQKAAEPTALEIDQEALKDEWRSAIGNAIILSSACEWMFETHTNFQQGEIDLEEAKSDLAIEADFMSFTRWDDPAAYQNEAVAEFMLRLERFMGDLVELIDTTSEEMIGSEEVLDSLFSTCGPLFDLQSEIVFTALDAGLARESVDELDISTSEMYLDFYDMIFGGD